MIYEAALRAAVDSLVHVGATIVLRGLAPDGNIGPQYPVVTDETIIVMVMVFTANVDGGARATYV